jgi:phage recombination protein Bet
MSAVVVTQERSLSTQLAERNITPAQWHTLARSLYPGARQDSVLMVIDYCAARGLDPLKKPCHIVPMEIKVDGSYEWRDVVMPGIYELRTTAMRTGLYLGHSKPEYGPAIDFMGVTAPEWCEITIYRWNVAANAKTEFPVRVYFRECCGTKYDKKTSETRANARWSKAPVQMLTKCTEGAGLREAFPDELGGQMMVEEMEGQRQMIDVTPPSDDDEILRKGPVNWKDRAPRISPKRMRKIVDTLNGHAEKLEGAPILEIIRGLHPEEYEQVWKVLRSWERTAIKKALGQKDADDDAAALVIPAEDDLLPWAKGLLTSCLDWHAVNAAWAAIESAYDANGSTPPDELARLCDERRGALST